VNRALGSTAVLLMLSISAAIAQAQSGPVCTVNADTHTPDCSGTGWLSGVTCGHKTVSCPSVNGVTLSDLGITYGYKTPPSGTVKGTIVFFSHSGGITPDAFPGAERTYAADYFNDNYQIVQTAWDLDWEDTGTTTKNIAYAAGRPAAFLSWAKTTFYDPVHGSNPLAGMCMQGTSAGAAAGAYALAWYGAGSGTGSGQNYLDKAELLSGPTLSDIERGCEVLPNAQSVTVCPSGQLGCNAFNSPSSWTLGANYTDALSGVRTWTGDSSGDSGTCRRASGYTSGTANAAWKAMSIVDGTVGTFNYPSTNITTWLCSSVQSADGLNDGVMNNSSTEAQLFFQNFTSSSQTKGLTINGVTGCLGTEGVSQGTPPSNYSGNGKAAIESDMLTDPLNKCTAHH
jgi:hypothetical protein